MPKKEIQNSRNAFGILSEKEKNVKKFSIFR